MPNQRDCFKGYNMSTAQDKRCIGMAWLVDSSTLLKDNKTRVIFYDPQDDLHCHDALFELEGMTVEVIAKELYKGLKLSYEQVLECEKLATQKLLRTCVDL